MIPLLSLFAAALAAPTHAPATPSASAGSDRGNGVAIGFDTGLWGSEYGSGWKVDLPVHRYAGVRVRTATLFGDSDPGPGWSPTNTAAAEVFVRSPVVADRFRFSAGGGPSVAIDGSHQPAVGGGAWVGSEALLSRRLALTLDLGGQTGKGAASHAAGVRAVGGLVFYLGRHR